MKDLGDIIERAKRNALDLYLFGTKSSIPWDTLFQESQNAFDSHLANHGVFLAGIKIPELGKDYSDLKVYIDVVESHVLAKYSDPSPVVAGSNEEAENSNIAHGENHLRVDCGDAGATDHKDDPSDDHASTSVITPPAKMESDQVFDVEAEIGTVGFSTGKKEEVSEDDSSAERVEGERSSPRQQRSQPEIDFQGGYRVAGPIELGAISVADKADNASHAPTPAIGDRGHDDEVEAVDKTLPMSPENEGVRHNDVDEESDDDDAGEGDDAGNDVDGEDTGGEDTGGDVDGQEPGDGRVPGDGREPGDDWELGGGSKQKKSGKKIDKKRPALM